MKACLIFYGVLNAVLYASLLPLWAGFDEPFHYAYVLTLSRERVLPRLGDNPLPADVWTSLHIAPASSVVRQNLPWAMTFSDFFAMPPGERAHVRTRLDQLPSGAIGAGGQNYEAHQAPLAYFVLALVESPWRSASLLTRVWRLRLFCGVFAAIATPLFLFSLAQRLQIPHIYHGPLVFVVLSSQMFYATTAHIANDWLAVPLMIALFDRLLALVERPDVLRAVELTAVMCAGLLTKAYFMALLPLVTGVLAWLAIRRALPWRTTLLFAILIPVLCGPWYLRNLRLYGNLSGMQETIGGTDWRGLAVAFVHVPWLRSIRDLSFASIWTGNSSFNSFSSFAIAMLLAGFVSSGVLYTASTIKRRELPLYEAILLLGCASFAAALVYATTVSFWYSKGKAISASPWYTQPVMPILMPILFCGLARFRRIGAIVSLWIVWWSAYIISATYWAKLIPLYAGYPEAGKTVLVRLVRWYSNFRPIAEALSATALKSAGMIFALAAIVAVAAILFAVRFSAAIQKSERLLG